MHSQPQAYSRYLPNMLQQHVQLTILTIDCGQILYDKSFSCGTGCGGAVNGTVVYKTAVDTTTQAAGYLIKVMKGMLDTIPRLDW